MGKRALPGNPILRLDLRDEARNHTGDTGLLDHLLKHMAGKVVNEGRNRFMGRHNGEGVMDYWLEPKEFDELQKTTGGNDPYWNDPYWAPPIGCKSGDGSNEACVRGGGEKASEFVMFGASEKILGPVVTQMEWEELLCKNWQ